MIENPLYSLKKILEILELPLISNSPDRIIQFLLTDSRRVNEPISTLFFCLNGKKNSLDYIPELYQKGVRCFVIETKKCEPASVGILSNLKSNFLDADFLPVPNSLLALQAIASFHRRFFHYPVVGITGSNGKTIVKEWLYQLLSPDYFIVRSPKSYNSQIGVPLSVWAMNSQHSLGIFEAGISEQDEMESLERIILPTIGIFTNIGSAHDKGFLNRSHKINEKLKLFENAQLIIYSPDYISWASDIPENYREKLFFTWSMKVKADLQIIDHKITDYKTNIKALYQNRRLEIEIPFTDKASIENAVICWAVLIYLKYDQALIYERMKQISPLGMRLELKQGIGDCTLINDSYSLDLPSLEIALDFLNQQNQNQTKTVILSDIPGSGLKPEILYENLSNLLKSYRIKRLIGIGQEIGKFQTKFNQEAEFYESTTSFLKEFSLDSFYKEAILIKGARCFEFERITHLLEKKVHETQLEINLNALTHNYNFYRSILRPKVKIMVMVKAFSYGLGSNEVASLFQHHRVDYLAVAYVDEGIALRKVGIKIPILVLNGDINGFSEMTKNSLEPEIYSFRILNAFITYLKSENIPAFPVHLKIDTGMHRLGFNPEETEALIEVLIQNPQIEVKSIFSHLSSSEDEKEDSYTRCQIKLFTQIAERVQKALGYTLIRHIANSAAAIRLPEAQLDLVRLGIGLYGIGSRNEKSQIQPVGTLKTSISQIRQLKKGDRVGYNREGVLYRDSRIATVKIGYADGYRREFGKGIGKMLVRGALAPVVGKICMDMTMLDITDTGGEELDEVIVFNEVLRVEDLASQIGTISYELLSGISTRVKRVYYFE